MTHGCVLFMAMIAGGMIADGMERMGIAGPRLVHVPGWATLVAGVVVVFVAVFYAHAWLVERDGD